MWIITFLSIILALVVLIGYFFVVKPYLAIQSIKKAFQSKGYKVLVQKLNFNDDTLDSSMKYDLAHHKDALHRFKTTWQNYDVTIKNSFFLIVVSLNSIELIKQAYKQIEDLPKPPMLRTNFARLYGGGLSFKEGEEWKNKRKLYSEIFNFKLLQQLHPIIQASAQNALKSWRVNQQIDLLDQSRTMFFNTFTECYFGRKFHQFSYKNQSYSLSIATVFQQLLTQSVSLRHLVFGTQFLQKGYFKQDALIEERVNAIKLQTKQFVKKRFQQILQSTTNQNQKQNILSKLVFNQKFQNLQANERQKAMEDITGDLLMFFFAGTDTTSAVLVATLHLILKNPQVKNKLIEQLEKSQNIYNHATIKNWKYMDAVMNEVLRLYGPFNWIFVRQILNSETNVAGINLPKDSILTIQSQTIHCSQKYYERPYEFIPERFLGQKNQEPYSFVPFGGGQRNCIGQYLAKIQYKIGLAKILRRFNFMSKDDFVMHTPSIYLSQNNKFILEEKI